MYIDNIDNYIETTLYKRGGGPVPGWRKSPLLAGANRVTASVGPRELVPGAVSPNSSTKQHSKTGFSCWRLLGCSGSPQSSPTQQPGSTFFEGSCTWAFPK